jgi:branched-chain amino acid transport system ATP-binding protein
MDNIILQVKNLTKDFNGVRALNKIDMGVKKHMIHGLIGPNGSGKTTFFNAVTGLLKPTEGRIRIAKQDITGQKAHQIAKMGISRTFQGGVVVPTMNCLQNVMVGAHQQARMDIMGTFFHLPFTRSKQEKRLAAHSREMLEFVGLSGYESRRAGDLVWIERQLLQIARALSSRPKLLLLDEPTSGMGNKETDRVKKIINQILDIGVTIILISHNVDLVMDISSVVTVISYGDKLCDGTPQEVKCNTRVLEAYLGTEK